jgi:hypothetical protein
MMMARARISISRFCFLLVFSMVQGSLLWASCLILGLQPSLAAVAALLVLRPNLGLPCLRCLRRLRYLSFRRILPRCPRHRASIAVRRKTMMMTTMTESLCRIGSKVRAPRLFKEEEEAGIKLVAVSYGGAFGGLFIPVEN